MINIHLSRAEALHIIELLNKAHDSLTQSLLIAVEDENAKDEVVRAAKLNYVTNLEAENERLEKEVKATKKAHIDAMTTLKEPTETQKKFIGKLGLEITQKGKVKHKSVWQHCNKKLQNFANREEMTFPTPSFTTFQRFRDRMSAAISMNYKGQFKTRSNKENETVTVTRIKDPQ